MSYDAWNNDKPEPLFGKYDLAFKIFCWLVVLAWIADFAYNIFFRV